MKSSIKAICRSIVTSLFVIFLIYIACFTDIPQKTVNLFKAKIEEYNNAFEIYDENFKVNDLTINMSSYYYNTLTEGQKKIYASIANATKNFQSEFVIRNYEAGTKDEFAGEVKLAIGAFMDDHPEAFYLKANYSSYVIEGITQNYGYVRLNYTEDDVEIMRDEVNKVSDKISQYIEGLDGKTEFEKEVIIHDRLSYDVVYSDLDEFPREYHTAEGPLLEGIGVCDGFAKALQLVYNKAGIDSIIVLGVLDEPHAWNLVKIENEWYHVDLTSSHSVYGDTGVVNHGYFNLSDEKMKKFATMDEEAIIPRATSNKYNFYVANDLVIDMNQDIDSRLRDIVTKYEDKNYIEFYLEGDVSQRISNVLTSLRSIDNSFITGSKLYYYNIENAIIIPKN